jgi:hypothetical protein
LSDLLFQARILVAITKSKTLDLAPNTVINVALKIISQHLDSVVLFVANVLTHAMVILALVSATNVFMLN